MLFAPSIVGLVLALCAFAALIETREAFSTNLGLSPTTVCAGMTLQDGKYNQMLKDSDEVTNAFLPIYTNHPLDEPTKQYTSAVVFIHGGLSDADNYWCIGMNAAQMGNDYDDAQNVLVIAPLFGQSQIKGDQWQLDAVDGAKGDVSVWFDGECWDRGCDSNDDQTDFTSSFDALDQLISTISNTSIFPYLKRITIAGFSAGSQMTNRYSWASLVGTGQDPAITFVMSNAGYHLYLDTHRPAESCRLEYDTGVKWSCDHYEIPKNPFLNNVSYAPAYPENDHTETCSGEWEGYEYDISTLPAQSYGYMKKFAAPSGDAKDGLVSSLRRSRGLDAENELNEKLINQYTNSMRQKDLRFMFGSNDTCKCNHFYENPEHCFSEGVQCSPSIYGPTCCDTYPDAQNNVMSVACGAEMQGANRLQRGLLYMHYLNWLWKDFGYKTTYEVIDNGHNATGAWQSDVFQKWAFAGSR